MKSIIQDKEKLNQLLTKLLSVKRVELELVETEKTPSNTSHFQTNI